jgi:protein TonB
MLKNHHYLKSTFAKSILTLPFFIFLFMLNCHAQETKTVEKSIDDEPPMRFVSEFPEFPGGMDSLFKFIQENLIVPDIALPKNNKNSKPSTKPIQVFVEFVIEKDGSTSNVKVLVGVGPAYDEEAVRVVKMLPPWKPGKHNGKLVRTYFNIPIRFTIN